VPEEKHATTGQSGRRSRWRADPLRGGSAMKLRHPASTIDGTLLDLRADARREGVVGAGPGVLPRPPPPPV